MECVQGQGSSQGTNELHTEPGFIGSTVRNDSGEPVSGSRLERGVQLLAQKSLLCSLSDALAATLDTWSLFRSLSGCRRDIPLTCAFAEPDTVLLLIGRDLVSQDERVPAGLSVTSLRGKAASASAFPYR